MGREMEWKFSASPEQLAKLAADQAGLQQTRMETIYYDSPFRRLGNLRWTLRRRMENDISVCTLKTPAGDGARNEWEVECGSIMAAIPKLCQLGAPMELMVATVSGVIPVCGARFTRQWKQIVLEDCTVELALDSGVLTGNNREIPLSEVEIEYKAGSEEAAARFAQTLADTYGLIPEGRSKFARALALAAGNDA